MPLGVGHLVDEVLKVNDEGFEFDKSLCILDALDVTLVSMAIHGADNDDPRWARHLQLEVGAIRDGHELVITRPPPRQCDRHLGTLTPRR